MLRGTVYVSRPGIDRDDVSRHVVAFDVETEAEFISKASIMANDDLVAGYEISFGPIAPPWAQ